jgi:hypothetical protein
MALQFFGEKSKNHLENCQVFAGYFMKPDGSLRFLKYTEFVTLCFWFFQTLLWLSNRHALGETAFQ